nr:MAG TPA: hypothetical protein [Caudoviricetes sp.]
MIERSNDNSIRRRLGLFTEAPKRSRMINGAASGRLSDFTNGAEPEQEIDTTDTTGDDPDDGADFTDGSDDETLETDDPAEGGTDDTEPDTGDSGDDTDFTDGSDGDDSGNDTGDNPPSDGDDPDTGDDSGGDDFTAGADEDDASGDADTGDTSDGGGADGTDQNGKQNFKKDNMQKYILFNKFISLRTTIDQFVTRLEKEDANDYFINQQYRKIHKKFSELSSFMYDYMVLKYANDTYIGATYIYEQIKAAVLILLQMLNKVKTGVKEVPLKDQTDKKKK